jgi:exosortase D (VPLPA-CTERM-specific)
MAEGLLHDFQGWTIFMISAALMLGEIAVLNRIGREAGTWRQLFGVEFPAPTPTGVPVRKRLIPTSFTVACFILLAFVAASIVLPRPREIYPARESFDEFPMHLGDWRGRRESLDPVYSDALKLDDYLLADYVDSSQNSVNLYIAYYKSQRKGEAVHSPRSCLPGAGWQIRDFGQRTLSDVAINGRALRVNRGIIELGDRRQLVYYWFQQRGRVIDNEFAVKWYLFRDALTEHRTDGALVRVIAPLPASADETEADHRLTKFIERIAPDITRYVPN